jgi:opacity protein-like surface antigen
MSGKTGVDMNRIVRTRKSALLGGSALMLVMFAADAHAQCTNTLTGLPGGIDPAAFTVIATGGSVNSLVSVLNTTGTAFLNQTNAFIGAPANPQPNQVGGGVWTRGVGGRFDTDSTGVATAGIVGGPALGGNVTCNTTTRTEFAGYQAGVDLARLNVGGWNLHGGVTVGYVESDAKDITPGLGTFSGNFQVPFAGVYGAATYGGFYVDAQVRWDLYRNNINDPVSGVFNQSFNANGIAFAANAGYNYGFGNGWFIEPSGGIIWSRTEVDPLAVSGTFILGNSSGIVPPTTVQIGDIESLLGRLSLRAGTTVQAGSFLLQPFATASIFHEFEGNVTTNFVTNFGAIGLAGLLPNIQGSLSTSRIGTYEQFSVGIAGLLQNTGWLGYARFDYRTGDNVEGWQASGGIRYQFTPDPIVAPVGKGPVYKAPPAPVVAAVNWTGFYVGGTAGTTWGRVEEVPLDPTLDSVTPHIRGVLAGGEAGFNYQFGSFVVGIEGNFDWSNAKGATSCPNNFFFTCESKLDSLWMVTGRLGYAVDRSLFYVKGGYAAADVTLRDVYNPDSQAILLAFVPLGVPVPCPSAPIASVFGPATVSGCPVDRGKGTLSGWTIGAGFEFALTQYWSAKAEYMYYNLTGDIAQPAVGAQDVEVNGQLVRVGVNYRFSGLFGM